MRTLSRERGRSVFAGVIFVPRWIGQAFRTRSAVVADRFNAGIDVRDGDTLAVAESLTAIDDQAVRSIQALRDFDEVAAGPTELHRFLARELAGKIGCPYVRASFHRFDELLRDHQKALLLA